MRQDRNRALRLPLLVMGRRVTQGSRTTWRFLGRQMAGSTAVWRISNRDKGRNRKSCWKVMAGIWSLDEGGFGQGNSSVG